MSPRTHKGWTVYESGPAGAEHAALLLPGGLCTAAFYDDVLAEPRLADAGIRFAATTVPGFGGTAPLDDVRFESYAAAAAELAADLGCDVVVGHSMGANIALEMLGSGRFTGPAVLLSPSFSHEDEAKVLDVMDRLGRVPGLGPVAWWAMLKAMPRAMKKEFPPARGDALVAAMQGNDPRVCRALARRYFEYVDRHGSLVPRLCDSGVRAWVAFGDGKGEVGLTDEERRGLESCPSVELVTIRGSGHLALVDNPAIVAGLILDAVTSSAHV
ncbi:MAG: alpha/beta hydrolase [Actinomycetota bacterium]|nr:alpha/beta hydrolase [Actinomycetota bacterium]